MSAVKSISLSEDEKILYIYHINGDIKIWNINPDDEEEFRVEQKIKKDGDITKSQVPIPLSLNGKQLLISFSIEEQALMLLEIKPAILKDDFEDISLFKNKLTSLIECY